MGRPARVRGDVCSSEHIHIYPCCIVRLCSTHDATIITANRPSKHVAPTSAETKLRAGVVASSQLPESRHRRWHHQAVWGMACWHPQRAAGREVWRCELVWLGRRQPRAARDCCLVHGAMPLPLLPLRRCQPGCCRAAGASRHRRVVSGAACQSCTGTRSCAADAGGPVARGGARKLPGTCGMPFANNIPRGRHHTTKLHNPTPSIANVRFKGIRRWELAQAPLHQVPPTATAGRVVVLRELSGEQNKRLVPQLRRQRLRCDDELPIATPRTHRCQLSS